MYYYTLKLWLSKTANRRLWGLLIAALLSAFIPTPAIAEIVEGTLEALVEDHPQFSIYRHFLLTPAGDRLELRYPQGASMRPLRSGSRIRVNGLRSGPQLMLSDAAAPSVTTLEEAALVGTLGEQRVLVLLVNFQDNTAQPFTPAQAQSIVFDTAHRFYQEASYGQTYFSGQVAGWYTLNLTQTSGSCDANTLTTAARNAAIAAGINVSQYNRHVIMFPELTCYSWWGLSSLGGNPSRLLINGGPALMVVGHEMGHSLGLYHAKSLRCGSTTFNPDTTQCTTNEYGDMYDIMGGAPMHFNAHYKELLGWMTVSTVTTSGIYSIHPIERSDSAVKGLQVTFPGGTRYFMEYRQRIGFDIYGSSVAYEGAIVHWDAGSYTDLLDMRPTTGGGPPLRVGHHYIDSRSGGSISVLSADSTQLQVSIQLTPETSSPCDINSSGQTDVTDVQQCANQAIGAAACARGDINQNGSCDVIDVQRVVNAILSGVCQTP
jgi:hypothetical protein